jgi:hypothetical protein
LINNCIPSEISIIGPSNICVGGNTNLFSTTGGIWTSLNPSIATIKNNGEVGGISPGQARFLFTNLATGCLSDTSSFIIVEPGPEISFTGPQDICIGETTSISPASDGTWMSTNNAVATIDDNGVITAISQGSAAFIYTETSTGCTSDLSETLTVHGKPIVFVSGPNDICIGGITLLSPSSGGTWTSLNTAIATVDNMGIVTGVLGGVVNFVFTDDATGCESDGDLSVTILDGIDVSITGHSEICLGYTTTLSPSSGGFWISSNPDIATVSNTEIVTAKAPGIVTFEFTEAATGCIANGSTDPITVELCTNHDFNVTLVDLEIQGNVFTNDDIPSGITYGGPAVLISKPPSSLPELSLKQDGTYTFSSYQEGKYIYSIPVCIPPIVTGCSTTYLEIDVKDGIYSHANPVSNLEFATTLADVDELQNGMPIEINAIANEDCVYTSGCDLDLSSVAVYGGATNGNTTVNASGIITYTPQSGFIGKDTIYYSVCVLGNPTEFSESFQVVSVNHTSVLNSVVAADDFAYTLKETPIAGNVMTNDSDPEGDGISVITQGSITILVTIIEGEYFIESNGDFYFTPSVDFSGSVNIVYTLYDNDAEPSCTNATSHLIIFDDIFVNLRVYLQGALMQNGGATSAVGQPLMRDDLRVSPFTGLNYIPLIDPYSFAVDPWAGTHTKFNKIGPGLLLENQEITDSLIVFGVSGDNAIVDWIHVELRSKADMSIPIATRSGLLQRDGDVVDLDGISDLRFNAINVDSFYVVVKHRSHLGVMSQKVSYSEAVDFTSPTYPIHNFGVQGLSDFSGLSQNNNVLSGYSALWAGGFDSNGRIKFTNPGDDQNVLFVDVLFTSPDFLINFDHAFGYMTGDFNMNSKTTYTNPSDDINFLYNQILFYPLNGSFLSNYDSLIEKVPEDD